MQSCVPDSQTYVPYGHMPFNSTTVGHICWCRGCHETALGGQKIPVLLAICSEEPRH